MACRLSKKTKLFLYESFRIPCGGEICLWLTSSRTRKPASDENDSKIYLLHDRLFSFSFSHQGGRWVISLFVAVVDVVVLVLV